MLLETIKPIRSQEAHLEALRAAEALFDKSLETKLTPHEADSLTLLTLVIHDYEARAYPLPPLSARDLVAFVMEQRGLRNKDLIPYLGSPARVSEFLHGRHTLTALQIAKLAKGLRLPASSLLPDVSLEPV